MCFCQVVAGCGEMSPWPVRLNQFLQALPPKAVVLYFKRMEGNMKKLLIGLFVLATLCSNAFAGDKPRIGVIRFTNNTHASWWHGGTGSELQDMLIAELASTEAF